MSNTPKNGDFAAYVDDIQLRQQRALQLLPAHALAKGNASKSATGFANPVHKEGSVHAAAQNPSSASGSATKKPAPHKAHHTDDQTRKHNATSHAQLADHAFGRTANDIKNDANKAAAVAALAERAAEKAKEKKEDALPAPQDAWESRWQPVFLFVVENRSKFIGLMLAAAVTIISLVTMGFALAMTLGFELESLELPGDLIKNSWVVYWTYWTQSMARTKILLAVAVVIIGLCVRYIVKTWNFIVEFAARESDINTFIGVLLGLALLEAVMFFKIGISGVVWVAVLLGGGATKSAWRIIVALRRVLLNRQPA